MINLARHSADEKTRLEVTSACRKELEMARIPVVEVTAAGEVPSDVGGQLGEFKFSRAWYYWIVQGNVPIALARKMYEDPLGKATVRVDGHCMCPSPDQRSEDGSRLLHATWIKDGKHVISTKEEAEFAKVKHLFSEGWTDKYIFHDDPAGIGAECFVDLYHIDDLAGLRLFADTVLPLVKGQLNRAVEKAAQESEKAVAELQDALRVDPAKLREHMTI